MKKLKVDIGEIAFTMETSDEFESITLFDTETGEADYPDEEKRWFAFKDKKLREEVVEWLNDLGIEPKQD